MIGQVFLGRLAPDYMNQAVIGSAVQRNAVWMEAADCVEEHCVTILRMVVTHRRLFNGVIVKSVTIIAYYGSFKWCAIVIID